MAINNLWPSSISRWNIDSFIKFCDDHGIDENLNSWEQWLSETNDDNLMENALQFIRFIFDDNELINHILSDDIRRNFTDLYGPIIVLLEKEETNMAGIWQYLDDHFDIEITMKTLQHCFRVNAVIGSDPNAYKQVHNNGEDRGHCDDITKEKTATFRKFCVLKWKSLNKLRCITDKNANLCQQLLIKNPANIIVTTCNGIDYIISDVWKSPNKLINQQLAMSSERLDMILGAIQYVRIRRDSMGWRTIEQLQDAIP